MTQGISSRPTVRVSFSSSGCSGSSCRGGWGAGSCSGSGALQGCHTPRTTARANTAPAADPAMIFCFFVHSLMLFISRTSSSGVLLGLFYRKFVTKSFQDPYKPVTKR